MTRFPRTAEEIISDPEYQKKRKEYDRKLKAVWMARDLDAQPLLDDLRMFGLNYDDIGQLAGEPPNTFALAIPRMVEYLDTFKDAVNIATLAMALVRPEAKGFAAKPLINFFKSAKSRGLAYFSEDTLFQVARAIHATAMADDIEDIINLLFDKKTEGFAKVIFLRTIAKLGKGAAIPIIIRCLDMEDEVAIEALRIVRNRKISIGSRCIEKLQNRKNTNIRELVRKII